MPADRSSTEGLEQTALAAAAEVRASPELRARIDELRRAAAPKARTRRRVLLAGASAALAATALALALALPGGSPGAPSVVQAAALADRGPSLGPPRIAPGEPWLAISSGGIEFPSWERPFGWRATGARRDGLKGHGAVTVFYADRSGRSVAYTIVDGKPLDQPAGASTITRSGITFRALSRNGRTIVTWRRLGHTCVLSGTRIQASDLVALAAWRYT